MAHFRQQGDVMAAYQVPSYFRYGEPEPAENAELVHCQNIFSRISEQNWEIRPHRHKQLWQLFLVEEGELDAVLEFDQLTLIGPCVVVVPVGRVHGFSYGEGARGIMISVSDGFLRAALEHGGISSLPHWADAIQVATLSDRHEDHIQLRALFTAVKSEAAQRRPGYLQALAALLQLLFVNLDRAGAPEGVFRKMDEQVLCFDRFRDLVAANMRQQLNVADYCHRLGIGERRLNRICHGLVGESPLAYIHRQMMEEAKRYLVHTAMPITSIGYELGFGDSAYFSRFFRKHAGVSPSAFAAAHRQ